MTDPHHGSVVEYTSSTALYKGGPQTMTPTNPHPMPGWAAIIRYPNLDVPSPPNEDAAMHMIARLTGIGAPVVTPAVVIELGDLTSIPYTVPFTEGDTVYLSPTTGTEIGPYTFVVITSIVAWEKSP
jgi:hypothetical protein